MSEKSYDDVKSLFNNKNYEESFELAKIYLFDDIMIDCIRIFMKLAKEHHDNVVKEINKTKVNNDIIISSASDAKKYYNIIGINNNYINDILNKYKWYVIKETISSYENNDLNDLYTKKNIIENNEKYHCKDDINLLNKINNRIDMLKRENEILNNIKYQIEIYDILKSNFININSRDILNKILNIYKKITNKFDVVITEHFILNLINNFDIINDKIKGSLSYIFTIISHIIHESMGNINKNICNYDDIQYYLKNIISNILSNNWCNYYIYTKNNYGNLISIIKNNLIVIEKRYMLCYYKTLKHTNCLENLIKEELEKLGNNDPFETINDMIKNYFNDNLL